MLFAIGKNSFVNVHSIYSNPKKKSMCISENRKILLVCTENSKII